MKRHLGVMALGLGFALIGGTASWAQNPGNGTTATPPASMGGPESGGMNSPGTRSERRSTQEKNVSPASPNASIKQEK